MFFIVFEKCYRRLAAGKQRNCPVGTSQWEVFPVLNILQGFFTELEKRPGWFREKQCQNCAERFREFPEAVFFYL
jgi:hypothetical protein